MYQMSKNQRKKYNKQQAMRAEIARAKEAILAEVETRKQPQSLTWESWSVEEPVVEVKAQPQKWVDPTPPKTAEQIEKERVEEYLKEWPWVGSGFDDPRAVTVGPFMFSGNPFAREEVFQNNALCNFLHSNEDVALMILKMVFQRHTDAWKFAATCRQAYQLVRDHIGVWDLTDSFFNHCEIPRDQKKDFGIPDDEGGTKPILVVTPRRRFHGPVSYPRQVRALHGLCKSVSNYADFFHILHLHRVPFLSHAVLSVLIPEMRNLKMLGIYQCPLLHVGSTMELLKLICVDKVKEKSTQILLDYHPMYHQGPAETEHCRGNYAATWDNWNGESRLAIWALLYRILPMARSLNCDFESKGTGFRTWLEKTQCWKIAETLQRFKYPYTPEVVRELVLWVDFANTEGKMHRFDNRQGYPRGTEWPSQIRRCGTCRTFLPTIFFYGGTLHNLMLSGNLNMAACLGCRLTEYLEFLEEDHFKPEKSYLLQQWLYCAETDEWNTNNLKKAIADFEENEIEIKARAIENARRAVKAKYGYDKETQERQRPYTREELSGKRGAFRRSPTVLDSRSQEEGYELRKRGEVDWDWARWDRFDGHGAR